jgi:hypothetical protein
MIPISRAGTQPKIAAGVSGKGDRAMAKKAGKAKAAGKKKAGKKKAAAKKAAVKKAKKVAKKAAVPKAMLDAAAPKPAALPKAAPKPAAVADPKNGAVNSCVNDLMNSARPGWSDNGKMDADYQYNNHSMRAFLSTIKACLQGKHYTLDMNDDDFVNKCVSAAVYQLKLLIYGKTT